ncbi:HNH endonuclease [Rhodocytophaga aerolata]|uniref:HNH endonuclease n=1 Tax=Rhodocytophaga aerolata TaxID=455078 RepID=A0ABT8RL35_9BACT|nr:HNH endonuclease [Rhodocytophaga aerolata]MDO1451737.1 HNH endonuclease [Rhodocytophaga aerolata]
MIKYGKEPQLNISKPELVFLDREPTEEIKEKIFKHDNYTCQCCGKAINPKIKKERKQLQIDHIVPYKFGGDSSEKNLQTLCVTCNGYKNIHEINFRVTKTPLTSSKELNLFLIDKHDKEDLISWKMINLKRVINFFYHSKAVLSLNLAGRSKQVWEVELYQGNNPQWLENEKSKLLHYIKEELQHPKLEQLIIK